MQKRSAAKARKKKDGIRILLSNDDGIKSPGIQTLAKALSRIAHVTIVAPEREQSTMGHALTLHKPIRIFHVAQEKRIDQWATSGTPADCVYMGLRTILKERPDLIISGINNGVNVGNDMYYSGTVAAAREGAVLGIPAMATSLDYHAEPGTKTTPYFDDAAEYIAHLVPQILANGIPPHCLLNLNFPNVPMHKIAGVRVSRQGFRIYTDKVEEKRDSRGKPYYWLGGLYAGFRPIEGSDCEVLDKKYISITPCRIDVTQCEFMEDLARWDLEGPLATRKRKR